MNTQSKIFLEEADEYRSAAYLMLKSWGMASEKSFAYVFQQVNYSKDMWAKNLRYNTKNQRNKLGDFLIKCNVNYHNLVKKTLE